MTDILEDLRWRELIAQSTDVAVLGNALTGGRVALYCGFDPTADSLHAGNLVPLLTLRRFQLAGHQPILLAGGATGLIGDPSGRDAERTLSDLDEVRERAERIGKQLYAFFDFSGHTAAVLVNNLDWTHSLSALEFLRDIGKHFPINQMLARDSVATRLAAGGLSYTEFSYQLLQAYDFLHLYQHHNCRMQIGGSDQWGNLTAGLDLIRRVTGGQAHALTVPLVTTANGEKFGKSTGGGKIWLDPTMTSPYAWYQFWLNSPDAEVIRWLKLFTMLDANHIETLATATRDRPAERSAQNQLANEMTTLVHGEFQLRRVTTASAALFGRGDLRAIDPDTLTSALHEAGHTTPQSGPFSLVALLKQTGLSASLADARRIINSGGAYLNNTRVTDPDLHITKSDLIHNQWLVLRRGRHNIAGADMSTAHPMIE